jgi:hypothetical protein
MLEARLFDWDIHEDNVLRVIVTISGQGRPNSLYIGASELNPLL